MSPKTAAILFAALWVATFFSPIVRLSAQAMGVRAEELMVAGLCAFSLNRFFVPVPRWLIGVCLLFAAVITLSNLGSLWMTDAPASIRNLFEYFWLLKLILTFFVVQNLVYLAKPEPPFLARLIEFTTLALSIIAILQFMNPFGIAEPLLNLYALRADAIHQSQALASGRIYGTAGNPNLFGTLLLATHVAVLQMILDRRRFGVPTVRVLFWLILFSLNGAIIVATLSRTALAATLLVTPLQVALVAARSRMSETIRAIGPLFLSGALLIVATVALFFSFESRGAAALGGFAERIGVLFNPFENEALTEDIEDRARQWERGLELFYSNPLLGEGSRKDGGRRKIDNEFILMLRRYGILGLLCYVGVYGSFVACAVIFYRRSKAPLVRGCAVGLLAFIASLALFNLTGGTFYSAQVMSVLGLYAGALFGLERISRPVFEPEIS